MGGGEFLTFPNKIFGKGSHILIFLERVSSFWLINFLEHSSEKHRLICQLYGLCITFGEEPLSGLWGKVSMVLVKHSSLEFGKHAYTIIARSLNGFTQKHKLSYEIISTFYQIY